MSNEWRGGTTALECNRRDSLLANDFELEGDRRRSSVGRSLCGV